MSHMDDLMSVALSVWNEQELIRVYGRAKAYEIIDFRRSKAFTDHERAIFEEGWKRGVIADYRRIQEERDANTED